MSAQAEESTIEAENFKFCLPETVVPAMPRNHQLSCVKTLISEPLIQVLIQWVRAGVQESAS